MKPLVIILSIIIIILTGALGYYIFANKQMEWFVETQDKALADCIQLTKTLTQQDKSAEDLDAQKEYKCCKELDEILWEAPEDWVFYPEFEAPKLPPTEPKCIKWDYFFETKECVKYN